MNEEARKQRMIWGIMLLIGALGCASVRNNPALGMTPLAIGIIDGLIYACILIAVRFSSWRMAALIGIITPIYLWAQRFLDGFMIPVEIAVHMTLVLCMYLTMDNLQKDWVNILIMTASAFIVMILGSTVAIWLIKKERIIRAFINAWNTEVYSALSILVATLISVWFKKNVA